jgi:RHS repeat-associated protein
MRFPGHYYLAESGLHYNYFRDYDPQTGRYIESDPLSLAAGVNTYAYVEGNPISNDDPFGLDDSICLYNPAMCGTPMAQQDSPLSPGAVNALAGLGDSLLFGTGGYVRGASGIDGGVESCSDAYRYGSYAALAIGVGRLAYAGLAKAGSIFAASGAEASTFREGLKSFFRGGAGRNWRPPNLIGKTDAELRASAGTTNLGINAYGAGVAAASGTAAAKCGCSK